MRAFAKAVFKRSGALDVDSMLQPVFAILPTFCHVDRAKRSGTTPSELRVTYS